jgi:hypothetical protein
MEDLEDIKQRLAKVEAENAREWDIIKSYFSGRSSSSTKRPSFPKGKRSWKKIALWGAFAVWQVVSGFFRGFPDEFIEMFL